MKWIIILLVVVAPATWLASKTAENQLPGASSAALSNSTAHADSDGVGERLFAALDQAAGPSKNVFFSPVSVEQAFGLLHAGTRGETQAQIEAFFRWPVGAEADHELRQQRDSLLGAKSGADIKLANAVWVSDDFQVRAAYLQAAQRNYGATARTLDFDGDAGAAAEHINHWTAHSTNGLIDAIASADTITSDTAVMLTNAFYFEARWPRTFLYSEKRRFLFGDGHEELYHLMKKSEPFAVATQNGWSAIRLPYIGERFAMDVIMLDKREVIETSPDAEILTKLNHELSNTNPRPVDLLLPRFEITYSTDLSYILEASGLNRPFDGELADLSSLAALSQTPLFVSGVLHSTRLQVSEDGTKAVAVTSPLVILTSAIVREEAPTSFIVDRPFIVILRDLQMGLLLYIGRVAAPEPF